MKFKIGDVYWFEVTYRNGEVCKRPVVIIELTDDLPIIATFVALTHSGIEDFNAKYDKWKVPLFGAKRDGFGDSSYAKVNCTAEVDTSAFKHKDYMGNLNINDVVNIRKKVNEFIDSDEEYW